MFGYQRSTSYGTAIERILHGSFTGPSKSNAVLVKVIYPFFLTSKGLYYKLQIIITRTHFYYYYT